MDLQNLQTAAHYVNNLLLSRGLLRNGMPIEFAQPAKGQGGVEGTMAGVINLVHDLVLRRDRESESLASLSQTISTLRTTASQQAHDISRLEAKATDLERQLALSASQEKTAKTSLKTAESRNRALREEMQRVKAGAAQVRTQCANDVRKRDTEISRLQKHLEMRRGQGAGASAAAPVGVTILAPNPSRFRNGPGKGSNVELDNPSYSLKEETTEFLTQLGQNLSDENDALIELIRSTLHTLRSLQGLPEPETDPSNEGDQHVKLSMPPTHEQLAAESDDALEHLRQLLTNPNFVPLEEVEVREEEILRLRDGWDRMESRWRDVLALMNGWKKRMLENGDTINLDDLRKGLKLSVSEASAAMPLQTGTEELEEHAEDEIADEFCLVAEEAEESEDELMRDEDVDAKLAANQASPVRKDPAAGSIFPVPTILQATSANANAAPTSPRVAYRANSPRLEKYIDQASDSEKPTEEAAGKGSDKENEAVPAKNKAKRAREDDDEEPRLTVKQKLDGARREAERAVVVRKRKEEREKARRDDMVRAQKEKQDRAEEIRQAKKKETQAAAKGERVGGRESTRTKGDSQDGKAMPPPSTAVGTGSTGTAAGRVGKEGEVKKPVKRTAIPKKVRSKRRSTLSPEELQGLMGVS